MQALHEKRYVLEASREQVWNLITSLEHRKLWQKNLESTKLLFGKPGSKGAKIQLNFEHHDCPIIEHTKQSQHLVRLQLEYRIGERRYRQIFNFSRIDSFRTSLMYYCQLDIPNNWSKVFSKGALVPSFLDPDCLSHLETLLTMRAKEQLTREAKQLCSS